MKMKPSWMPPVLFKRSPGTLSCPFYREKKQRGILVGSKKQTLPHTKTASASILDFSASRAMKKKIPLRIKFQHMNEPLGEHIQLISKLYH